VWGFDYFLGGEVGRRVRSTTVRDKEQKKALGHLHVSCPSSDGGEDGGGPYACVVFFTKTYLLLLLLYPQKSTLMIIMVL